MDCIKFNHEDNYINDFLKLPKKLYNNHNNMEDYNSTKKLLLDEHPLSKYFKLNKFLIYKNKEVVGRFIITEYLDEKKVCYIGFFECINDNKVARFLFNEAEKFAKEKKYKKIIGPVDASFWIKYRLKINIFNKRPYTGEPYNLDYYFKLFKNNKYKVIEHYTSNFFDKISHDYSNSKYIEHYSEFNKLGYKIVKPNINDFDKCIEEIYKMIMNLYSDFPIFKSINKDDFIGLFSNYKKIINMSMVRMAYYKGNAVGFFISIPNYNNRVYHLNFCNILKILTIRRKPKEYIMLYMGVLKEHQGLGKALVYEITEELKKQRTNGIGALMRDGKITQKYSEEIIDFQYEYVLMERTII